MCLRSFLVLSFLVLIFGLTFSASATAQNNSGQRLTDGPAIFDYTDIAGGNGILPVGPPTGSDNVSMNFQLAGSPGNLAERQLVRGNWFYRVAGDNRERYLSDATSKLITGPDYVKWTFSDVYGAGGMKIPDISAEMDFQLTSFGPDSASLSTGLCFTNNSATPIQVETFFVVDFNLGATIANDVFQPLNTAGGGRLIQVDDNPTATVGTMYGVGAIGSAMGDAGSLFIQLNDNSPSNFFPDVNSGGPFGDSAALLQFTSVVQPSPTPHCTPVVIDIARTPVIPEPTGLSLVGILLLVSAMRRNNQWGQACRT